MAADEAAKAEPEPRGLLKSPQDFAGGLFLILFAVILYSQAMGLRFGQLRGIGPGLMPQVTAIMLGAFGIALVVSGLTSRGAVLGRWSVRGLFFVLGAVLLFALTIRGASFPELGIKIPSLGLLVSGPLAVLFASMADRDTRLGEVLIYTVCITAFCIGLFKYALRLPIPLAPWWLGY
jgi:putative tricarboxylic transport membrane protein